MNTQSKKIRHFLSLNDLNADEISAILAHGLELKQEKNRYKNYDIAKNKHLAMIFETQSTRTRVSFETGINQLGGHAIVLSSQSAQIGRGEAISDTSEVISRMVDMIAARIIDHQSIEKLAEHSKVPVINALSNRFHPCQILADIFTFIEIRGSIKGAEVAWIGDGNNVCHSWMNAARLLDFKLKIATPEDYQPDCDLIKLNQSNLEIFADDKAIEQSIDAAITDADIVVTDTWISMGDEDKKEQLIEIFSPYKVTNELMKKANPDALFMHCLPAYRGLEVDEDVIDGPQSVVWNEAENRLHVQKALLLFLFSNMQ